MEITLNLPENVYRNFTELAQKKQRRIEEVIADQLRADSSLESADFEAEVAAWSDEEVLALAKLTLPKEQSERMSALSELAQRGIINKVEESELGIYLELYNNANLRKACGIAEAARRGLITPADDLK
jgi:hypothetical protein